ncbi:MAG: hypothetical protein SNJ70_07490, partial [Armatimonadota bacterium]
MTKMKLKAVLLIVCLAILTCNLAHSQETKKETATANIFFSQDKLVIGKDFKIAVEVNISPDIHIGANTEDALYPAKLTFSHPDYIEIKEIKYPKEKRITLSFSPNEEIPVYEGTIYIFAYGKVKESVRSDTKAEIKAILDIQGCTDTQ